MLNIPKKLRIAVDIGGTFTDLAAFDETGRVLSFGKSLSTYGDLVEGIQATLDDAQLSVSDATLFLHGSTVVINNLLERTGAKTALLITEGFRDIYEIGRINRPDAYNLYFKKHQPLVPRSLRYEITERMLANGDVLKPLDENHVRSVARELREKGIEAVAVLLLHSYKNSAHERRTLEILAEELPDAFITASHELSQEYREFERCSTVVANAYVGPRVETYLRDIDDHLRLNDFIGDFYAVQSTGGLFPVADARRLCVNMLESGPAAGVVGVKHLCDQIGLADAVAFDMGGTTAKAGLVSGGVPLTSHSAQIGHYGSELPIQLAMIDIFEVGTGGGSIARVEAEGGLRVGPRSAGSSPGPACYGRGGRYPTVTDANLVLGRLDEKHFLGGDMPLDGEAAKAAVLSEIAGPLGLGIAEAGEGILQIASTAMSYAVKGVTTERGLDAGSFAMVVYGGAGPLHASGIAREIGIRRVIIPYAPGHFSAFGMLFGDLRYDYVRSIFRSLDDTSMADFEAVYREMEAEGAKAIQASVVVPEETIVSRFADMRYVGQEHAVTVELDEHLFKAGDKQAIKLTFDKEHLQRYGTSAPKERAEIVSLRVTVSGKLPTPVRPSLLGGTPAPSPEALDRRKPVFFSPGGFVDTPVYKRDLLQGGNSIQGPALIEERASTTVLMPGDVLVVDPFGNLDISIGAIS
jgi:N-methylhydantoinase A